MKSPLHSLAHQLATAKANEEAAKTERLRIESEILQHIEAKPNGTSSKKFEDDTKLTVVFSTTYKLDLSKWEAIKSAIPTQLHPIKLKQEPDVAGIRWLKENRPDLYNVIAECVTATPAKPSVSVNLPQAEGQP